MNKSKEDKSKKDRMRFIYNLSRIFRGYRSRGRDMMRFIYKQNKYRFSKKDIKRDKKMRIKSKMKSCILRRFYKLIINNERIKKKIKQRKF